MDSFPDKQIVEQAKKAAAIAAVDLVPDKGIIGLGSGTTIDHFIIELAARIQNDQLRVKAVPTSYSSHLYAAQSFISLVDPMTVDSVDIAFDGADQIGPAGNLIKGRGAAQTLEKIVAKMAGEFVIIADSTKLTATLGSPSISVPVEVIPAALAFVTRQVGNMGGKTVLRKSTAKLGPMVTDLGNFIVDCDFGMIFDPDRMDYQLNHLPGVVDHGLFISMAEKAVIGRIGPEITTEIISFQRKEDY